MKRIGAAVVVAMLLVPATALPWSYRTHRWINERAIGTLASPLREHFARHRERLSDLAVEPDTVLRRRDGRREAVRHFINLDLYGPPPFVELPRSRRAASRKFGSKTVSERGTLPWRILELHARLRSELREERWGDALRTAGLAGHYVGDAFMPLHTTTNHDGQKTGNRGIHRVVESELVDARLDRFRKGAERRLRPDGPKAFGEDRVFSILLASYDRVGELLRADRAALAGRRPGDRDLDRLEARAGEMITGQLAGAVDAVGAFWRSAWEEAGRPAPPAGAVRRGHVRRGHLDSPPGPAYDPCAEWRTVAGGLAAASP